MELIDYSLACLTFKITWPFSFNSLDVIRISSFVVIKSVFSCHSFGSRTVGNICTCSDTIMRIDFRFFIICNVGFIGRFWRIRSVRRRIGSIPLSRTLRFRGFLLRSVRIPAAIRSV